MISQVCMFEGIIVVVFSLVFSLPLYLDYLDVISRLQLINHPSLACQSFALSGMVCKFVCVYEKIILFYFDVPPMDILVRLYVGSLVTACNKRMMNGPPDSVPDCG